MHKSIHYKLITFCLLGFSFTSIFAQEVISTQGDHFSNTAGNISFTIGEVMVATYDANAAIMTQGFHQSNLVIIPTSPTTGLESDDLKVNVFPNPATDFLMVDSKEMSGLNYQLHDIQGSLLLDATMSSTSQEIDLRKYSSGLYLLRITTRLGNHVKTYRIIKNKVR